MTKLRAVLGAVAGLGVLTAAALGLSSNNVQASGSANAKVAAGAYAGGGSAAGDASVQADANALLGGLGDLDLDANGSADVSADVDAGGASVSAGAAIDFVTGLFGSGE